MNNRELTEYYNEAIGNIVSEILKHSLQCPRESIFLLDYRKHSKTAMQVRLEHESRGNHIPAFLISSITNSCNLFCNGCYARNNGICQEESVRQLLSADKWADIFKQAEELGISFHLLAGGEPLMRRDIIHKAAEHRNTIFPIFTNGTLIDDAYLKLFDQNRNLIPILSIEGEEFKTDQRRGEGIFSKIMEKMRLLRKNQILFGVSITVSKDNLREVSDVAFVKRLHEFGCRIIIYVEYVPVDGSSQELAFSEEERSELIDLQSKLRKMIPSMLFLSFPGDEKELGGCLAAGRGFIHINPFGEAEACPFSPYSDRSLEDFTLFEVLQSPFFKKLQESRLVGGEHSGGCALFEHEDDVKSALESVK